MAGGYAAGSAAETGRWLLNTVYAPSTVTTAETFLWYTVDDNLRLGVAHLWKQNAFRALASVRLSPETANRPAIFGSLGVQGIGTGNPGLSLTAEKNFDYTAGRWNVFAGFGYRTNENHGHMVAGTKFSFTNGITLGVQADGHDVHPFLTYSHKGTIVGFYLIDGKDPAYMLGVRF